MQGAVEGRQPPRAADRAGREPLEARGKGAITCHADAILMEDRDWADSLLVTEVWTPAGTGRATPAISTTPMPSPMNLPRRNLPPAQPGDLARPAGLQRRSEPEREHGGPRPGSGAGARGLPSRRRLTALTCTTSMSWRADAQVALHQRPAPEHLLPRRWSQARRVGLEARRAAPAVQSDEGPAKQ